jgi:hypothetical protein
MGNGAFDIIVLLKRLETVLKQFLNWLGEEMPLYTQKECPYYRPINESKLSLLMTNVWLLGYFSRKEAGKRGDF